MKKEGKRGEKKKKEKSESMKLKWPPKNPQKQGRILEGRGGGEIFFWLARIYTPVLLISSFESVNFTTDCFFTIHTFKPFSSQATFLTSRLP